MFGCELFRCKAEIIEKGGDVRIPMIHVVPDGVQAAVSYIAGQEMGLARPTGAGDPLATLCSLRSGLHP